MPVQNLCPLSYLFTLCIPIFKVMYFSTPSYLNLCSWIYFEVYIWSLSLHIIFLVRLCSFWEMFSHISHHIGEIWSPTSSEHLKFSLSFFWIWFLCMAWFRSANSIFLKHKKKTGYFLLLTQLKLYGTYFQTASVINMKNLLGQVIFILNFLALEIICWAEPRTCLADQQLF